jgi:hypothetical protein
MPNTLRVALSSLVSFAAVSLVPTILLGRIDPATVERRMHAGPTCPPTS